MISRKLKKAREQWQLYLLLLIPLLYLIVYCYFPMVGLQIAFRKFKLKDGIWGSAWVGMKWLKQFISNPYAGRIIRNTFLTGSLAS